MALEEEFVGDAMTTVKERRKFWARILAESLLNGLQTYIVPPPGEWIWNSCPVEGTLYSVGMHAFKRADMQHRLLYNEYAYFSADVGRTSAYTVRQKNCSFILQ